MNNKVEILAPAGNYDTFLAVLNAGADAVYLGGRMFGARAYAGNLSEEEIINAVNYAHIHGRRVYLTVNTLVKNNELFECLYDYLKPLYEAGLDGVIVQDYGVMKYICDCFPDMEIHASTQMTVTDILYSNFLKQYNVKRIVPARELSLEDIRIIRDKTDFEIECFVHGALCYCYSGMCLMSSFIGGRSGNRGRCAQPCRLDYSEGNILSLKDLCTLDILPDIVEAGVFSLKIEGRMKSSEYAAGVTEIYRKYVDMYLQNGRKGYRVDHKDREKLLMLFDRGGMTEGYYNRHNGSDMIAWGNKAPKSLEEKDAYEKEIARAYLNRTLKEKINIYVNVLKNKSAIMTLEDENGHRVSAKGCVPEQARNLKMTKADIEKQLTKLGNTDFIAAKTEITADEDIFIPNKSLNELRRDAVELLYKEILKNYSRTAKEDRYGIKYLHTDKSFTQENNSYTVTARVLTPGQVYAAIDAGADRVCAECELMSPEDMISVITGCRRAGVKCFLGMPRVFKNGFKDIFDNAQAISEMGFDGFYIRNISELEFLRENNIEGTKNADYTVYGFNDLSVQVLYEYGCDEITFPVELNRKELSHLNNPDGELIVYGKIPLMISANCIDKTCHKCHKPESRIASITDRKDAKLMYVSCCRYCYNVIYNSVPVFLLDKITDIKTVNPRNISLCFTDESEDLVYKYVKLASDISKGKDGRAEASVPALFTRGHFTRGVE